MVDGEEDVDGVEIPEWPELQLAGRDLPLKSKSQVSLIAHELMALTHLLAHQEVTYTTPTTRYSNCW